MDKITARFTVLFEDPFWIGIYERERDCREEVCKITFGAQPKEYEVQEFLRKNFVTLKFSPPVTAGRTAVRCINPKRMQREVKRQMQDTGISTKAQQALSLQREQGKLEKRINSKAQKEAEKERHFEEKQEKKKAKHRGH